MKLQILQIIIYRLRPLSSHYSHIKWRQKTKTVLILSDSKSDEGMYKWK